MGSRVVLTLKYHLPEGVRLPAKPEIKGLEALTLLDATVEPKQIKVKTA